MPYTLTLRVGSRVRRERHPSLGAALGALEEHLSGLGDEALRERRRVFAREYEPDAQVAARGEIAGPRRLRPAVRAGADVRGDGSIEAYVGRLRREVLDQRPGESPFDTLRRVLDERGHGA